MRHKGYSRIVLIILVMLIAGLGWSSTATAQPYVKTSSSILYVKPGANGDCTAWATACELQYALSLASQGDQVWVAAGNYKPTTSSDRSISFVMKSGVAIFGGFPAVGGDWDSRNWVINPTTLSGDIGTPGLASDNSFHVLTGHLLDPAAILDGFTISGGNADDPNNDDGGGMDSRDGNPTLRNLIFSHNSGVNGGGLHLRDSAAAVINVTFSNNSATYGGGLYIRSCAATVMNSAFSSNSAAYGGGLFARDSSSTLVLMDIAFANNTSSYVGGGMVNSSNSPLMVNLTFSNNSAHDYGGGLDNYASSPTLTNVTFSGNSAPTGGGIFNTEGSNPSLNNLTVTVNSATTGGGIYNWNSNPIVTNSIVWGNTPSQITNGVNSTPVVTYSDIQGGYPGIGNIDLDPNLAVLADNGGHTSTHALLSGSKAIDAGNQGKCPTTDQRGYFRRMDGNGDGIAVCDMGSYEYGSSIALYQYVPIIVK